MGIREGRLGSFRRRSEVSLFLSIAQFEIYDNEHRTADTSNMEGISLDLILGRKHG